MLAAEGALKARLEAGLGELAVPHDGRAIDRLWQWLTLHERWSRAFNLTGTQDAETLVEGHLLDCAAVLPALTESGVLYDVGTGAGLPGLILAALAPERPFVLVESLGKRVRFLEEAIVTLALPQVTVFERRAEQVAFDPGAAGILVRAVAPLERLCALLQGPLAAGGRLLAMKGAQWEQEWAALGDRYRLEARYAYRVPSYDHERVLLKVRSKDAA